jgi:PBP1b-binding outer membrane lipoprotein LpoB
MGVRLVKKMGWIALAAMVLSGCAQAPKTGTRANWDQLVTSTKVAKVSNVKSLISPGFY